MLIFCVVSSQLARICSVHKFLPALWGLWFQCRFGFLSICSTIQIESTYVTQCPFWDQSRGISCCSVLKAFGRLFIFRDLRQLLYAIFMFVFVFVHLKSLKINFSFQSSFRFTPKLCGKYRVPRCLLDPHMHSLVHYQHPSPDWYIFF